MATFSVRKDILGAFIDRWNVIRPAWDHNVQTSLPPKEFEEPEVLWIKVICTNHNGSNDAVGFLDRVDNLMTVDCYSPFDEDDPTTMFAVDDLANDVHNALRSMIMPEGINDFDIVPRDFPLTATGFEHKRLTMFFNFYLPEVT